LFVRGIKLWNVEKKSFNVAQHLTRSNQGYQVNRESWHVANI